MPNYEALIRGPKITVNESDYKFMKHCNGCHKTGTGVGDDKIYVCEIGGITVGFCTNCLNEFIGKATVALNK